MNLLNNVFIGKLFSDPEQFFIQLLVVVFSICCHEFSHAWMALKQGDPTAAEQGHLTLNPLKQMGVFSLLMMAFIGIAWGQVPVNPKRMKHHYSDALVSFAGPGMNLLLFFVFSLLTTIAVMTKMQSTAINIFFTGAFFNMVLFVLNMLPIPPFDGWSVLNFFFPQLQNKLAESEFIKGAMVFSFILVLMFSQYIFMFSIFATKFFLSLFGFLMKATGMF